VPNAGGELLSGLYAQVHLTVRDPRDPLLVPAAALVVDAAGPQVVDGRRRRPVRRRPVTLGRDLGKQVEVTTGLSGDERLIPSPRDDLRDGDKVEVR
jgi:multidrug efflux pump subunit AcrA (membrane-fusion protein)